MQYTNDQLDAMTKVALLAVVKDIRCALIDVPPETVNKSGLIDFISRYQADKLLADKMQELLGQK